MALPANYIKLTPEVFSGSVTTDKRPAKYLYDFKSFLVSAGWTVLASGDGLSAFSSSGDVITNRDTGANGINDLAWYVIGNPDGRQICVQAVAGFATPFTTAVGGRLKYSFAAGFTGGTPSATQVPSATDEGVFCGNGTDAAPTAGAGAHLWGSRTGNSFASTLGMYSAIAETVSPYRFLMFFWEDTLDYGNRGAIMMDVCRAPISPAVWPDPDPAVLYVGGRAGSFSDCFGLRAATNDLWQINSAYTTRGMMANMDVAPVDSAQFLPLACVPPAGLNDISNQDSSDQFANGGAGAPVFPGTYARYPDSIVGGINAVKGYSSIFALHGYPGDAGWGSPRLWARDGSLREYLQLQNAIIPWDGTDPFTGWVTAVSTANAAHLFTPETVWGGAGPITRTIGAPSGLPEDIPGGFSVG